MEAFSGVRAPKLIATLSAVKEVVQAQLPAGTEATGTHYFGALMSGLEGAESGGHWAELLRLLSLVLARKPGHTATEGGCSMRWVPVPVLRNRFAQAMRVFASVLQRGSGLGLPVLRPLISCIGSVLAQQDPAPEFWKIPVNKRALMNIAELLVDERPKIRRAANDAISDILEDHRSAGGVAAGYCVVEFCEHIIEEATLLGASSSDRVTDSKRDRAKKETMALQIISFVTRCCKFLSIKSLHRLMIGITKLTKACATSKYSSSREAPLLMTKALHQIICNREAPMDPSTIVEVLNSLFGQWNAKSSDNLVCAVSNVVADGMSRISKMPSLHCKDSVRRQMAIDLLSPALTTLCGTFHSKSAQVLDQTANACARIIVNCVDERLVVETNQVISTPSAEKRISLPLEKAIESLGTLLHPQHAHAWPHSLPLVTGLFRHLGAQSSPVASPILLKAAELLDDNSAAHANIPRDSVTRSSNDTLLSGDMREQIKDVVGAAVESMGAASFLRHVPIGNPEAATSAEVDATMAMLERRLWVLPVLKQHVRRTRSQLACFHAVMVKLAILCESKAKSHEQVGTSGMPVEVSNSTSRGKLPGQQIADVMRTRSMQLWELFASFCVCPTDVNTYFGTISSTLGYALRDRRYPVLQRNVCAGLAILIRRQYRAAHPELESNNSTSTSIAGVDDGDQHTQNGKFVDDIGLGGDGSLAILQISEGEAQASLGQISKYAKRFLPLIFTQYELMHSAACSDILKNSTMEAMLEAAAQFCMLADAMYIDKIANTLLKKLLKATTATAATASTGNDLAYNATALMGLSHAIIQSPKLSGKTLHMFFRTLRPLIAAEENSAIQKRAYKVLADLCENHISRAVPKEAEWSWLEELAALMQDSLLNASSTVKRHRLHCLSFIVQGINPQQADGKAFIVRMISEVILCTKESNSRTREAAFNVLIRTAQCMQSVGLLDEMITMVIAGLAAKTSHMRSATVFALSRLIYEFTSAAHDGLNEAKLGELVLTVCVLLHEKSREVVKAVIGFVKVVSVRFSIEALTPLIPTIVTGLMNWAGDSKNRFRQRIRVILERLIRRVGYEAIAAHVPTSDAKLMTHIAKMKLRKERRRDRKTYDENSHKAENESKEIPSGRHRRGTDGATYQEIIMDSEDEDGEGEEMHEADGMLIRDDGDAPINLLDAKSTMHLLQGRSASARKRKSKTRRQDTTEFAEDGRMIVNIGEKVDRKRDADSSSAEDVELTSIDDLRNAEQDNTSLRQSKKRKGRSVDELNGSRFKSSKAGGDVRRKGDKLLPFAYVQMGSNFLSQRKKRANIRQLDDISGRQYKKIKRKKR